MNKQRGNAVPHLTCSPLLSVDVLISCSIFIGLNHFLKEALSFISGCNGLFHSLFPAWALQSQNYPWFFSGFSHAKVRCLFPYCERIACELFSVYTLERMFSSSPFN